MMHPVNPPLTLPIGTRVVTIVKTQDMSGAILPRGTVGIVAEALSDGETYRVRLPDNRECLLRRDQLAIAKRERDQGWQQVALDAIDLYDHVIFRCITGSRAYGLDHAASDVDRRGIYLPPADLQWSLGGAPEQLENRETEETYWELEKFIVLALRANPNILECLYTPLVEYAAPLAQDLLAMRDMFLSQLVYQTYNGYVMSQFKLLERDVRTTGSVKWKHAMHLIRLLLSGIRVLRDGFVPVRVETYRDQLLAIRQGEVTWDSVDQWRLRLHREFEAALAMTHLPERPDFERANTFLINARRSMVK